MGAHQPLTPRPHPSRPAGCSWGTPSPDSQGRHRCPVPPRCRRPPWTLRPWTPTSAVAVWLGGQPSDHPIQPSGWFWPAQARPDPNPSHPPVMCPRHPPVMSHAPEKGASEMEPGGRHTPVVPGMPPAGGGGAIAVRRCGGDAYPGRTTPVRPARSADRRRYRGSLRHHRFVAANRAPGTAPWGHSSDRSGCWAPSW